MPKSALITGITGQDGSYLAEFLLTKGYKVFGLVRRNSTIHFERLAHIQDQIELLPGDLLDQNSLITAIQQSQPSEVYNLASQSFVPDLVEPARAYRGIHRAGRHTNAGSDSRDQSADSFLSGLVERDVRDDSGDAAERKHPFLPAQPLRRRQTLLALDHGQLSRELRSFRLLGNPFQSRVAPARIGVCNPQSEPRGGAHQARTAKAT